jgi:transcriptional regulator with XRE-family HTH domain
MLGRRIREARLAAKLTQPNLAKLAGVSRSTLQLLEDDENVNLDTVRRVAAHLPRLRHLKLALDGEETLDAAEPEEVRAALADLLAATQRLITALGLAVPAARPAGTARLEGQPLIDDDTLRRIKELDAAVDAGTVRTDSDT